MGTLREKGIHKSGHFTADTRTHSLTSVLYTYLIGGTLLPPFHTLRLPLPTARRERGGGKGPRESFNKHGAKAISSPPISAPAEREKQLHSTCYVLRANIYNRSWKQTIEAAVIAIWSKDKPGFLISKRYRRKRINLEDVIRLSTVAKRQAHSCGRGNHRRQNTMETPREGRIFFLAKPSPFDLLPILESVVVVSPSSSPAFRLPACSIQYPARRKESKSRGRVGGNRVRRCDWRPGEGGEGGNR